MIDIIRKPIQTRTTAKKKEATHERIVEVAARAIRRSGYAGVSVADIMKEAGLTHGGFYAHFASREAMLAEAADRAGAESVAMAAKVAAHAPPNEALPAMLAAYLSKAHFDNAETGCPIAALGSEILAGNLARRIRRERRHGCTAVDRGVSRNGQHFGSSRSCLDSFADRWL